MITSAAVGFLSRTTRLAVLLLPLLGWAPVAYAEAQTFGAIAENITGSFESIVKLIVGISYLAGIGFGAAGIMKFKQHKDNPAQIPLGQPMTLVFISAALIWLPSLIQSAGVTIFGSSGGTQENAGGASGRDIFSN